MLKTGSQLSSLIGRVLLTLCGALLVLLIAQPRDVSAATPTPVLDLSTLARDINAGQVRSVTVFGDTLSVTFQDGQQEISAKEPGIAFTTSMREYGVSPDKLDQVEVRIRPVGGLDLTSSLFFILPIAGILLLFYFLFRPRQQVPGGRPGDPSSPLSRSRAKKITGQRPNVTFEDVAGVDEAKLELAEVVEVLKFPLKFDAVGARIPKGVLMVGPPGTGKTLLARAVAGEAGVPFFSISGSEFVEMYVGVGASRVRDLFDQAKQSAPCIVFIDEIDAVGRRRGTGIGGGNDEREQTLNQILVEMDGFTQTDNVIVIAATNRPDILDQALLRPGRFDRRVTLGLPDKQGRLQILKVHSRSKPLGEDVDLEAVARATPGFSGADIENIMNEAAILGARRDKDKIGMPELEESIDRVIAGPERRSRVMSERERTITAYHEAGHALVAYALPDLDPIHKISIVSRGETGGHTRLVPAEDRNLWTEDQLKATLAFGMGGLVAEEKVFGETTTGPESDLQKATEMARKMVTEYGMSKEIGPIVIGGESQLFMGDDGQVKSSYGVKLANRIDLETMRLIREAKAEADRVLTENRPKLDKLAETLIEQETVQGDELDQILGARTAV
jgi:cell division protease FtsH